MAKKQQNALQKRAREGEVLPVRTPKPTTAPELLGSVSNGISELLQDRRAQVDMSLSVESDDGKLEVKFQRRRK